ncbi:uncharacterized protein F5147DRAFT_724770 [Suillus discolor]|uniref:DUF6533 domain-containing protein n=1 Tax=Suillus discolor TaxID=1912936 RepID=A0A9P7EU49_9AGAM|nr:uncharacterized protein F5147DRAFT_724770 [Suillus discolor]KAG2090377.1 hypothetical protein F5147DRAFT_724770 [Suillus discolor]
MTIVSNSPDLWWSIQYYRVESYYTVASTVVVIYDWALTFEQEFELVWKRRWSVTSVLYLALRYGGIIYAVFDIPGSITTLYVSDDGTVLDFEQWWMFTIANIILGAIMITRLHAMYQRSRKMLIFLVVFFLTLTITSAVITVIQSTYITGEELVFSGTYQCNYGGDNIYLSAITWVLGTVWETLALYLSVRIAIKHFRERLSTGSIIEDCFTVLIKSHVFYFASFAAVASFRISFFSPNLPSGNSAGTELYYAISLVSAVLQMFLLGPRLVLSVREHGTRLVDDSDGATAMTTVAFQECTVASTDSGV